MIVIRAPFAKASDTVVASVELLDILWNSHLLHVSKGHLAKQEQLGFSVALDGIPVALAEHVSEVDSFAQEVAGGGGFWRGDSEPLREDS